jgi:nucleotide-binding universal stress UspA family protein
MPPTLAYLLVASLMGAGMLVAYFLGGSTVSPFCSECPHCRAIALDRERRLREAEYRDRGQPNDNRQSKTRTLARLAGAVSTARIGRPTRRRGRSNLPIASMRRILVGYDGTAAARRALDLAIELSVVTGAGLAVVSVVPHRRGKPIEPWDDSEEHARELLEAHELAASRGVAVELHEPVGEPAAEIAHVAEEGGFDAVMIGSSWSPRWLRTLQGSVSRSLAAHCHKTVITVR